MHIGEKGNGKDSNISDELEHRYIKGKKSTCKISRHPLSSSCTKGMSRGNKLNRSQNLVESHRRKWSFFCQMTLLPRPPPNFKFLGNVQYFYCQLACAFYGFLGNINRPVNSTSSFKECLPGCFQDFWRM